MTHSQYIKHVISRSRAPPQVLLISRDHTTSQLIIELNDTNELENRIGSMFEDRRYYIGYTDDRIGESLFTAQPSSEGWERRAHFDGRPYKVCTYFVKLGVRDKTAKYLRQKYARTELCLNAGGGRQDRTGIVYVLEYDYNAGK